MVVALACLLCSLGSGSCSAAQVQGHNHAPQYRVQGGDTLSGIAQRFGVPLSRLRAANSGAAHKPLHVGQVLRLPSVYQAATAHRVRSGETLGGIAARYGLSTGALVKANAGLTLRQPLRVGRALYIPARPATRQASVSGSTAHQRLQPTRKLRWRWPARGSISSGFGERDLENRRAMHYGIDIVLPVGTIVRAARAGRVIESRADYARGWGWTIILDHSDGWQTRYAHLESNLARVGERVVRGQIIGRSGNTGRSTGPHLHLGTYLRGVPQDPLRVLP